MRTDNKYELVQYIPTMEDLREYYFDQSYGYIDDDYLDALSITEAGYLEAQELAERCIEFSEMVKSHKFFDFLLGDYVMTQFIPQRFFDLVKISTGELNDIRRFTQIVSYHPNEGYAFVKTENSMSIQLISLNTSVLFEEQFIDVTGIDEQFFEARLCCTKTKYVYYIIKDWELLSSVSLKDWKKVYQITDHLPNVNGENFEPIKYPNGLPFYQDPTFLEAVQKNINLRILVPDHLKSNDEIIEDVKNLERLQNEHPLRDKIFASRKKDTKADEEASSNEMPLGENDLPF